MKFNSVFKTIGYGLVLGISLLPPGFSVATMAMILGIYEELINLLNELFSKDTAKAMKKIALLGIGAAAGVVVFSGIISTLFDRFPNQLNFFFIGLVVSTFPLLAKQANIKEKFQTTNYVTLILASILAAMFIFVDTSNFIDFDGNFTLIKVLYLILTGVLVSLSMVLPGLSGALVLMLIGSYEFLLESISTMNLAVISIVALGAVLGLISSGRLIKNLIEKKISLLYGLSMGLVLGSVPVLLSNGLPTNIIEIASSLVLSVVGYMTVFLLNSSKFQHASIEGQVDIDGK